MHMRTKLTILTAALLCVTPLAFALEAATTSRDNRFCRRWCAGGDRDGDYARHCERYQGPQRRVLAHSVRQEHRSLPAESRRQQHRLSGSELLRHLPRTGSSAFQASSVPLR